MAVIDVVANGLADKVVGDGETLEAVIGEQLPLFLDVFGVGRIDIEVVAPAGELYSIVAHFLNEGGEFFERHIGPLAGEQGDWT